MKQKTTPNLKASIHAKLQNVAKSSHSPFAEILQYYGIERLLYRCGKSQYSNHFILKGALMFAVWAIPDRRTTIDIDLLAKRNNQIPETIKKNQLSHVPKILADISVSIENFLIEPLNAIHTKMNFSKTWSRKQNCWK